MTVGERIKQRRLALGMNAETLAEKIGKSAATVYRYENGFIGRVDSTILHTIADALNTTPAYLMGWEDAETSPTDDEIIPEDELMQIREDMRRNPELRTLHSMARNVTRGEIKQIEAFIRAIRTSNDYDETDTP